MKSKSTVLILSILTLSAVITFSYGGLSGWNEFQQFGQEVYASSSEQNFCISGICFPSARTQPPDASMPLNIKFSPWSHEDLSIILLPNETSPLTFEVKGKTDKYTGGFNSRDLDYTGRLIRLDIGKVMKTSSDPDFRDPQVTLRFDIVGNDGNLRKYHFVNGYLDILGWNDSNYYQHVYPNSSYMFDFNKIPLSKGGYQSLNNVNLAVQNGTTVDSFTFSLLPEEYLRGTGA